MSKKNWISLAIILLVVGGIGSMFTLNFLDKGSEIAEEKIFTETITAIDVDSNNAKLIVVPTKEPEVKVELSGYATKNKERDFSAEVEKETLVVKWKEKSIRLFNFDFGRNELTVKISMPEKQYESIVMKNGNGKIDMEDIKVEQVKVKTSNGRINLRNIEAESVDAQSSNGELTLDLVSGNIKGKTSNGRINIMTDDLDRSMQLTTSNGKINIVTEKEPTNVTFDVQVSNGKINILDKYQGNATIGNGDHTIKLKTSNGSITVSR